MKILLVKPKPELLVPIRLQEGFLHLEPLELEIVAGGLTRDEEIKILDLGLEKNQFAVFEKTVKDFQPQLIGFTGYSTNLSTIKRLAKTAKSLDSRIITVAGGIHATLLPADFAVPQIDIIVRGEGGLVLREIVRRFKAKEPLFFDNLALSPGKDPEFQIKAAMEAPEYPEIDKIPLPRRDLVQRSRYFCVWTSSDTGKLETLFPQVASLRTSIGCAFSCSFCVIHQLMHRRYLQRSPEEVVDEIAALKEKYIYFLDDEMFLNAQRCREIAELLLKRGIKKEYISWSRSDTIVKHPEIFKLWKQAGLKTVYVGLESMDEEKLLEYKKLLPVETNRKAIAILKEIGITLHAAFIVHPDFQKKDFQRLEKEVLALCPAEVAFTVLSPSPGTAFWQENKERFICDPYYYYDCMHTILPTRMPLREFYKHFGHLTELALRSNPLRINKVRVPFKDFIRAIAAGTKYIIALQLIYKDYLPKVKKQD